MNTSSGNFISEKIWFVFHSALVILAWTGPFLFNWIWLCSAYAIVVIQFIIFNRCLVNAKHALNEENDSTFYSMIFDRIGWQVPKKPLRLFIRRWLYPLLAAFAICWQVLLHHKPLIF